MINIFSRLLATDKRKWFLNYFYFIWFLLWPFYNYAQSLNEEINLDQSAIILLSNYIKINSETGSEESAALFFSQKCISEGLEVKFFTNDSGSYNFIASVYPLSDRKPNIVFLNHMDVVATGNEKDWKYAPYSGMIAENRVWGRGALDNKGLAVIQLYTVLHYFQKSLMETLPYNVSILCVSGEENGGELGSLKVASNFLEEVNPIVIIGEGGSGFENLSFISKGKPIFGISIAEKGILKLKLSVDVKNHGHTSIVGNDYAHKRLINALYKSLHWNQKIEITNEARLMFKSIGNVVGGLKGFGLKNIHCFAFKPFLKRQLKLNPEIEGIFKNTITYTFANSSGNYKNFVSQSAEVYLDCRLLPGVSVNKFINDLKETINDTTIKIDIINKYQERFTSMPDFYFEKLSIAIKNTFKNAEVVPMLFPAYNDNAYFRKYGCPTYGINPMVVSKEQLMSIHNTDEFIDFDDIKKGISVYTLFIEQITKSQ